MTLNIPFNIYTLISFYLLSIYHGNFVPYAEGTDKGMYPFRLLSRESPTYKGRVSDS